jgi:LmbE family N-acetylglucosaminyl deacetylase
VCRATGFLVLSQIATLHRARLAGLVACLIVATARAALPAMAPITAADSLLIVAPHPDDESLCCAGLIHEARKAGAKVAIVWITDGDAFHWDAMVVNHALVPDRAAYRRLALIREGEAREAARILDVAPGSTYFLGYPDRGVGRLMADYYAPPTPWRSNYTGLRSVIYPGSFELGVPYDGQSLTREFGNVLDRVQPTLVFAPSPQDMHPDHNGAGLLVSRVLTTRGELGKLHSWIVHGGPGWPYGGYEPRSPQTVAPTGTGLQWEVLQLDEDTVAVKLNAVSAHRSQLEVMGHVMRRYVRSTELFATNPAVNPLR